MKRLVFFLLIFIGLIYAWVMGGISFFEKDELVVSPSSVGVITTQPVQANLKNAKPFVYDDYLITPLADFEISARVLSREPYWFGRESDLSPVDLALGWGRMSDPEVIKHIDISQSGRWYRWSTANFPIPRREIEMSSANMHMIPADDLIKDDLKSIPEGQVIRLKGHLVRVDADDGWHWVSSMTRKDTGARSCELFYVTEVQRL